MRDRDMEIDYYKKYEPIFGSWRIVREDFGYTYKAP